MQRKLIVALMILAGVLGAVPQLMAGDAVFRWVDKDGFVHYGDRAPDGVDATRIDVRPNTVELVRATKPGTPEGITESTPESTAAEGEKITLSRAEQSRQARAESRQKNAEEARKIAANCTVMRQQKASVEPSPRVMVADGNGGTRRLDDTEREDLLNEANRYLAENCEP